MQTFYFFASGKDRISASDNRSLTSYLLESVRGDGYHLCAEAEYSADVSLDGLNHPVP